MSLKYKDANGNWQKATSFHQVTGGGIAPEGALDITTNGTHDVTNYAEANVNVPVGVFPTGTKDITANGKSDVTNYQYVNVNVASSSGDFEPIVLSGDCSYAGSGPIATAIINNYPDKISTSQISTATNMFANNRDITSIPFALNFDGYSAHSANLFLNCEGLLELPEMNNYAPGALESMFSGCSKIKAIPESYANWDMLNIIDNRYSQCKSMFMNCIQLRTIPSAFLKNLKGCQTSSTYSYYPNMFNNCTGLSEAREILVTTGALTSNMFSSTFSSCNRLKAVTFQTNDDGTPIAVSWKNQTIDLSNVGFDVMTYDWYAPDRNHGISTDKWVYDLTTYGKLRNDEDWYCASYDATTAYDFSRFNKASALETIMSLPDCSSSGGTNTIKFRGAAGAKTVNGAINELTEAHIAIATAKGWTVTLV